MSRILICLAAAMFAGCGWPSSAPKETVGMFLSKPEYQGWESDAHKVSAQKEVERIIRKFYPSKRTFTIVEIRFYQKDAENGAYIDWENIAGETGPSYDKTLIYETVFQKGRILSRKYKCINTAGEYYLGKQHPVALQFLRFSYTLPLAESDPHLPSL